MKKKIGLAIILLVVIVLLGAGGFCYNYYSKYVDIDTIYPGVKIEGMDVGGMTQAEAKDAVEDYIETVAAQKVTLQVGEKEKKFALSRIGLQCLNEDAVTQAYNLGRSGNLLKRVMEIRQLSKNEKNILLQFGVDEEKTKKIVKKKGKSFQTKKKNASIKRKDDKFVITDEVDGISIDFDANAEKLIKLVEASDWDQKAVIFPMDYEVDPAKHTKEELSVIQDVLGTFTTSYSGSTLGRCKNVENGAELIDGSLLYPGDSFSVYDKVAPFNAENGYELAGSYENGKTIQTYGGGICQVSTTLYNAVLRAELNVTERSNHSMTVHYVELSEDAAISGTEKDLKFENNLDHPVYIEGKTSGDTITFTIYGKEYRDSDRTVEFVSEKTSTSPPSEKVIKDKTLEEGKKVVEQEGRTGYTARLWKVVYVNGEETERTQVNRSSYQSTQKIVRIGTKKKESTDKKKSKLETGKKASKTKKKKK